jgi:hypothetical protein
MINITKPALYVGFFGFALAALHTTVNYFLPENLVFQDLPRYHLILGMMTMVVVITAELIKKFFSDKVGFFYMGSILMKMAIVVLIAYPIIRPKTDYSIVFLGHLFSIFFSYLIFEVISVLKGIDS